MRVHKIRLDPTAKQEVCFRKACGVARFAYNWALSEWKRQHAAGQKPSEAALRKQLNAIKAVEFPWMLEVSKNVPQQAIKNLGQAYANAFRRLKLKQRQGRRNPFGFPAFKRKGVYDGFRADGGSDTTKPSAVNVDGRKVRLPRIGWVAMREGLRFVGQVKSATVSRSADGWYVSLTVETEAKLRPTSDGGVVGVDLGVNVLATMSDGTSAPSPKPHRMALARIARLSRSLSRKKKGSANRAKAKTKLARLHLRVANVRKDALHKLTTRLATGYSTIAIEDLHVAGMLKNRQLALSISDAGFGELRRQLEYKCEMTGARLFMADRFYPSSKTCSSCGKVREMPLSVRRMQCECGLDIDRDLNAALNLRRQALAQQSAESKALADGFCPSVKPDSMKQKTVDLVSDDQTL